MATKLSDDIDDLSLNHEINVTPFIDVILVLLIIFMVAAPLATSDVPVKLPSSKAQGQSPADKPIYLSLQQDKSLFIGNERINIETLADQLHLLTNNNLEAKIFIRGDVDVNYGEMMRLFNALRSAGYLNIGLVGIERSN